MSERPRFVPPASARVDSQTVERALATIKAHLPESVLVLLALHLDGMRLERAIGDLDVSFHEYLGEIRSATFERRTHWQRNEAAAAQAPVARQAGS